MTKLNQDRIYQRIGEIVVEFQWIENLLEQILWTLRDPGWKGDPRAHTADLWFKNLADTVETEFAAFLARRKPTDSAGWGRGIPDLVARCRDLARRRNRIVHATYVEVRVGDEVAGILLSDMSRDKATNEIKLDQETLLESSFADLMREPVILTDRTAEYGPMQAGDVISIHTANGGGWGDPKKRDPRRIATDIRNGMLTLDEALAQYGVSPQAVEEAHAVLKTHIG
jgi:hypothetical protein